MGMAEMKENDIVKLFAEEYGNSVGEALEKNKKAMAQVMVLYSVFWKGGDVDANEAVVGGSFRDIFGAPPKQTTCMPRCRVHVNSSLKFLVRHLCWSGWIPAKPFFKVPLVVEQMSEQEKESFEFEWKRFTCKYAKSPELGKQMLKQETAEMRIQETQRMPSYVGMLQIAFELAFFSKKSL